MAKATITFSDTDDGSLETSIQFEPAVEKETDSPAQCFAMRAMQYITKIAKTESEEE